MEDGAFTPNSTFGTFSDTAMDLDFMDQLLFEGCWLETIDGLNILQQTPSYSGALNEPSQYTTHLSKNPQQHIYQEQVERLFLDNPPPAYPKIEENVETHSQIQNAVETGAWAGQSESFLVGNSESGGRLWIGPAANPGPSSSVKDRLVQAIAYLKECMKDRNVLIQIWVPIKRGDRNVLTTVDQPYSLDPNCERLASYRKVSKIYHFAAEEDSKDLVGLPGRVFLGKLPEWTPDVRFFKSDEYPRIDFAQQYDVRGSLALPVFEQGSGTCLGVVEIVKTSQMINYRPELEHVCKALEAVDLTSSQTFDPSGITSNNDSNQAALPEIGAILPSICKAHGLPLALTWGPCVEQGNDECHYSGENYSCRFSTRNSACVVVDEDVLGFHEACSAHYLFQGQGIVGRAFTTNKQCFATDITAFSKTNYPLSHYARMFGLCSALAIPLLNIHTRSTQFVVELFFPKNCRDTEQQKQMLNSLPIAVQQACRSLHVVMDKELEEEGILPAREMAVASEERLNKGESQKFESSIPPSEQSPEASSWITRFMGTQEKGKGISVSWEYGKEPTEQFKVTNHCDNTQEELYHQLQQNTGPKGSIEAGGDSSFVERGSFGGRKIGEKRRTKTEKTISLQVLRQYFAGSLKDAAKSIGVCPTTLKRICRQHGITRWPSRKIKKVGHSLRKLQLVIDSVQGVEGAIQIGSFYTSFPELSSPNLSGMMKTDLSKQLNAQPDCSSFSPEATASKSPSSSCSQSSGSSICCSTGPKQHTTAAIATATASCSRDILMAEDGGVGLKRACSDAELLALSQEEPKFLARSQSHKTLGDHPGLENLPPLPNSIKLNLKDRGALRVKANFGEEKVRFSLQPNWSFRDLQQEIAKRFGIDDVSRINLKYLDDDHEWVLLTCDADLEECIDIYKSSKSNAIKISLHQASNQKLGSHKHTHLL